MESVTWKEVLRKSMKQPWGRQRAILLYFLHTMDLQVAQPVIFMIHLSWLNNLSRCFMRIKMALSSFNWVTWYPWGLDFVQWGPCFDLVPCIVFLSLLLITAGPMFLWLDCKWDGSHHVCRCIHEPAPCKCRAPCFYYTDCWYDGSQYSPSMQAPCFCSWDKSKKLFILGN